MKKILIVDDEPHNQILLQEILEDLEDDGLKLYYAADGSEALRVVQLEKPALVFMDVMLPDMDGLEICRQIKDRSGFEDIFIVMLTALGQSSDIKKSSGVSDLYITKPFKTKVIKDVVNRVFGCAKTSQQD